MNLSESLLQTHATPQAFERGVKYLQVGQISKIEKYGAVFISSVKGSAFYRQVIDLRGEKLNATCSCPYDHSGICKHIIAVGLAVIKGGFEEKAAEFEKQLANNVDLVNINKLRDNLANQILDLPSISSKYLSPFLKTGNHRNTMRVILGAYEGLQKSFLPDATDSPKIQAELKPFLDLFQNNLIEFPPNPRQGKEILEQIFLRWDKYEQALDLNFPGKSIRYNLGVFEDLMLLLAKNSVSAHFLRMKIEGYGIHSDQILRLKNFLN